MKKVNFSKHFKKIAARVKTLELTIADCRRKKAALEKQGCRYGASPLWKLQRTNKAGDQTKYLRLSYRGSRKYEYIGKDPAKIKAALASIDRASTAENLDAIRRQAEYTLQDIQEGIRSLVAEHCNRS